MDELLSLFDNDNPTSTAEDTNARKEASLETKRSSKNKDEAANSCTNDFGSSFRDAFVLSTTTNSLTSENAVTSLPHASNKSISAAAISKRTKPTASNSTPYDPITNLRITDRHTSLSSMLDSFSTLHYKSCALLVGLSKTEWGGHIVKSSGDVSKGISGNTNLVTSGIITNEVNSKFSKAGRAFAMLNLGDLPSSTNVSKCKPLFGNINSSITVFLFGDAIRILNPNTKRYLNRGYAVAILSPNLMPPKADDKSTAISLSVSDPKQIILIGKAVDCDRCRGTTRKRTVGEFGSKFEDVRCGTLVDVRMGGFCITHKKQGLLFSGKTGSDAGGTNNAKNFTFMQKQRMERNAITMKNLGERKDLSIKAGTRNGMASSNISQALSKTGILHDPHNDFQSNCLDAVSTNRNQQILKQAPMHMKKSSVAKQNIWSNTNTPISSLNSATERKVVNPYQASRPKSSTFSKKTADDVLGLALQRKRQKMSASTKNKIAAFSTVKKPVKVFHTEGYDGSVQVPKPSSTLFKHPSSTYRTSSIQPASQNLTSDKALEILNRQKNLANLVKEQKASRSDSNLANGTYVKKPFQQNNAPQSKLDDPFASVFGQNDTLTSQLLNRSAIFNAKSRFASAASAEEYARARSVVQQLEVKESEIDQRQERGDKKKTGNASNKASIITTGWTCKTCKTKMIREPIHCVRAGHDVRQQRELKEKKSSVGTRKDRMERHRKNDTDGGLTLGSGLEWSGWKGDST